MQEQIPTSANIANNAPTHQLERLDFISLVKRALAETKPWADLGKNPQLNHELLRERGFISQPYICDSGSYRAGFFKQGFPSAVGLYLAICGKSTNESLVTRLWPTDWRELNLLYRSSNNSVRFFNIDWRTSTINHHANYESYNFNFYPELFTATINSNPNFSFAMGFSNVYGNWHRHGEYPDYNPERIISVGDLPPIYIPWAIDLNLNASLSYIHPLETAWYKLNTKWVKVAFDDHSEHSNLMVICPASNPFDRFGQIKIDLVALTDKPTDSPVRF